MGSITTADKALSTEEDLNDVVGYGELDHEDGERLYRPEDEPEDLQERLYHNTCFEVAQLQAVLNQLVENKVEAIKQEAAYAQEIRRGKFPLMRILRTSGAIIRRLKRRGSTSAETKPSDAGGRKNGDDQRQSGDRKRRKRNVEEGGGSSGANGSNKGKRVNRRRIGSSSRPESPRYNPGIYHESTPQHSDEDIVFLPSPYCCDTDGHTTIPVDPAFDSDYISVKIDDDDDDEELVYAPAPQPSLYHLPHPDVRHLYHHSHQGPFDPNSWRHSCDMNVDTAPTANRVNIIGAQTDYSEEDEIKKAEELARRHRRRRRRKRRRRGKLAAIHAAHDRRQAHLSAVAVSMNEMRVMDPDELSKKARLAIAATACLLLFMCLLLVGVTLRMAPLIDEMVVKREPRL